ncbi:hypothetical protein NLJ89_g8002 [Agrocybe chaxingu]|uniref:MYND-type domain-containing protein n=1 Tax=Agrocybe chaxingu TaxID=84603 RepID=A0A9W8MT52_9AGAR|nr:hypothetical protein NLJ89_g8002 [Agrocybe chaxingu]
MSSPSSGNPTVQLPTVVTVAHPANKATFRAMAVPKGEIRKARENIKTTCSYCGEIGQQKCARCKIASYCSRECQRKDWPDHKKSCTEMTSITPRMVNSLIANQTLNLFLQVALVLMFNIATPPANPKPKHDMGSGSSSDIAAEMQRLSLEMREAIPNTGNWDEVPFIAKCKVEIRPSDANNFVKLVNGQLTEAELGSIEGMLHLSDLVPSEFSNPPIPLSSSPLSTRAPNAPPYQGKTRLEPWKKTKELRDRHLADSPSTPKLPICLLDFSLPDATQLITAAISIQQVAIHWVKQGAATLVK